MSNISHQSYLNSKAWPFEEALRIYQQIQGKTPSKGYVLFETGYGPSGLPHIGTFGEVVRTSFVRHAFSLIAPAIPTKMFCVSELNTSEDIKAKAILLLILMYKILINKKC